MIKNLINNKIIILYFPLSQPLFPTLYFANIKKYLLILQIKFCNIYEKILLSPFIRNFAHRMQLG